MLPNIPQFLAMPGYIEVPLALPQALSTSSCYIPLDYWLIYWENKEQKYINEHIYYFFGLPNQQKRDYFLSEAADPPSKTRSISNQQQLH